MKTAEGILDKNYQCSTSGRKRLLECMEEYASQHKPLDERLAEANNLIAQLLEDKRKLTFMIENGLGWKDVENDITMPHEI